MKKKKTPTAASAAAKHLEEGKEGWRGRVGGEEGWLLLPVIKVHLPWPASVHEADTLLNNVLVCFAA